MQRKHHSHTVARSSYLPPAREEDGLLVLAHFAQGHGVDADPALALAPAQARLLVVPLGGRLGDGVLCCVCARMCVSGWVGLMAGHDGRQAQTRTDAEVPSPGARAGDGGGIQRGGPTRRWLHSKGHAVGHGGDGGSRCARRWWVRRDDEGACPRGQEEQQEASGDGEQHKQRQPGRPGPRAPPPRHWSCVYSCLCWYVKRWWPALGLPCQSVPRRSIPSIDL